jgi:hypothetical protein
VLAGRLRSCLVGGTLLIASSCSVPPPTATEAPQPSETASAAPTATAAGRIDIGELPRVELDPALLTAVCDPEPVQIDPDAGETTILCGDAVVLGLRAASSATPGPITRIYVQRPRCAASPCSEDELSTATVIAWGAADIVAVRLDSRLDTLAPPDRLALDPWPPSGTQPAPEVKREVLDSVPDEVAARAPYPYCGSATYEAPPDVFACFSDSVLLGRPAEAIQITYGTEGGQVLDIVRFSGSGALTRYRQAEGRWIEQHGSLILGAPRGSATFAAWDGGQPID